MAILHRNPMPLDGALFVTNPRRRSARKNGIAHRPMVGMRNPLQMRRNALRMRRNADSMFPDQDMPNTGSISTGTGSKSKPKTQTRGATVAKQKTLKERLDSAPKYVQEYIEQNKKGRLSHKQFDELEKKAKAARSAASTSSKKKGKGKGRKKETLTSLRARAKALGIVGYSNAKRGQLQRMLRDPDKYQTRKGGGKRKKGNWDKVRALLAGTGLTKSDIQKLAKDVKDNKKSMADLRKLKSAIRSYSRNQFKVGRTRRKHAIYGRAAAGKRPAITSMKGMTEYQALFNPYKKVNVRKNPVLGFNLLATPLSWVQRAQDYVSTIPVVRNVAFAVTPAALMGGSYFAHMVAEPYVSNAVQFFVNQDIPVVSDGAAYLQKAPYTTTGVVAGGVLMGLSRVGKKPLFDKKAAAMVASALAGVGVVMDLFTKPVAQAAADVVAADADMGAVHMGAIDMGAVHMGAVHMGADHMGAIDMGAVHLGYGDASVADAYDCNCVMHPDEAAAAKAGMQAWAQKFGQSPKQMRSTQSLKSRHAGRHGHRFGWCIKMIGFENFQKIASLPPQKRAIVLGQLKQQAIASVPKLVAAQQQEHGSLETASVPLAGTFNGACGVEGLGYGAMMFAGQGY